MNVREVDELNDILFTNIVLTCLKIEYDTLCYEFDCDNKEIKIKSYIIFNLT